MNTPSVVIKKHLVISGVLFSIVLFTWPVLMALSGTKGTLTEQFTWITDHITMFRIQFLMAFLLSPSILYLLITQLTFAKKVHEPSTPETSIGEIMGFLFLAAYLVLNSISYASQVIVVPRLIEAGRLELAEFWYFNAEGAVAYFLNQMGYFFWAAGSFILFVSFLNRPGILRLISAILVLSAVLSVFAFAGLITGNQGLNNLTFFSGIVLLPVGILGIIQGVKLKK